MECFRSPSKMGSPSLYYLLNRCYGSLSSGYRCCAYCNVLVAEILAPRSDRCRLWGLMWFRDRQWNASGHLRKWVHLLCITSSIAAIARFLLTIDAALSALWSLLRSLVFSIDYSDVVLLCLENVNSIVCCCCCCCRSLDEHLMWLFRCCHFDLHSQSTWNLYHRISVEAL